MEKRETLPIEIMPYTSRVFPFSISGKMQAFPA
jgi:hypothetical protein